MGDDAPTKAVDPWQGRVLAGKYRLDQRVGEGAMGAVYQATQVLLEKTVAVKVMHAALTHDRTFAQRFQLEARAASRLDHPNSVAVLDFGEEPDGTTYIVMEFLRGRTLADAIWAEAPMPALRTVDVMSQALAALVAAHEAGIVHRDLKPENIMLVPRTDENGDEVEVAKVADFGIAKVADRRGEGTAPKLTAHGLVSGTPEYMSPEQASARPVDGRSDLYACGVILYEMITGRVPFEADSALAIALKHVSEAPRPFDPTQVTCPPALADVIFRALAKNPEARFADARAMRSALRAAVLGEAGLTMRPPSDGALASQRALRVTQASLEAVTAPPSNASTRSGRVVTFALVGAAVFGASALAGWRAYRAESHAPRAPVPRLVQTPVVPARPTPTLPSVASAAPVIVALPSRTLVEAQSPPDLPPPAAHGHARAAREVARVAMAPVVSTPGGTTATPPPEPTAPVASVVPPSPAEVPPPPLPPPAVIVPVPPPPPPAPVLVATPYRAAVRALSATNGVTRGPLQSRGEQAASALARCASRVVRVAGAATEATLTIEVRDRRLDELRLSDGPSWLAPCASAVRAGFEGDLPAGENTEYTVHLNVALTPDR